MIRKAFKKKRSDSKFDVFIKKYKIPREYLSINRKSVSKGVFWGLFWGFIPMPLQMLAVLAITPFTKFNVPIAFSMVWLSNPVTMPFMYYMEYKTGTFLLGTDALPDIELTLSWFQDNWDNIIVPLYIGTLPYSLLVSSLAYFMINHLWITSVKRDRKNRFFKR